MNVLAFETRWAKHKASDISWSIFIQISVCMLDSLMLSTIIDRYYTSMYAQHKVRSIHKHNKTAMYSTYNVTLRRVRAVTVAVEKQYYAAWVCVCVFVAFDIQNAMCVRHIVISGLPCCTIFFPPFLTNGTKVTKAKICVFDFLCSFLFETFLMRCLCDRASLIQ